MNIIVNEAVSDVLNEKPKNRFYKRNHNPENVAPDEYGRTYGIDCLNLGATEKKIKSDSS